MRASAQKEATVTSFCLGKAADEIICSKNGFDKATDKSICLEVAALKSFCLGRATDKGVNLEEDGR